LRSRKHSNQSETEGIADIEELNKILERAVNLKNFLKGKKRVTEVAKYVADHYRQNVEPLGYKAFLVAVDREACTFYKEALDTILPPEYSEIVFTGNNNDPPHLKKWHIDEKKEKQIRKSFIKGGDFPKILIITEKLLTGFDAPILYAMYLVFSHGQTSWVYRFVPSPSGRSRGIWRITSSCTSSCTSLSPITANYGKVLCGRI
jgi:type I restriction enzyme R subunit